MSPASNPSRTLRILTGVFAVIYLLLFIIEPLVGGEHAEMTLNVVLVYTLFLLFMTGYVTTFKNEVAGGFILLIWVIALWILGFFVFPGGGMALMLSAPVIPVAVLFIRNGYLARDDMKDTKQKRWEISLQLLLVVYTLLYLISVAYEFTNPIQLDFSTAPGTIMLGAIAIFGAGFVTSWKHPLFAGILMILWYALIIYISTNYYEFANRGPWGIFGVTILTHGILYIYYHFKVKPQSQG